MIRIPKFAGVLLASAAIVATASGCSTDSNEAEATPTAGASASSSVVDPTKPTVVLVHGAFADASSWSKTVSSLQREGYPVLAPANPLRGLDGDSSYLASVLSTIDGPVILVGHSYGGAVVTNAATTTPNVQALVYIAAYAPDEGESIAAAADPVKFPGSEIGPDTIVPRPIPGGQDADIYIDPAKFHDVFAGDVSQAESDAMAVSQRPLAGSSQTQPSGVPAWRTLPSWTLVTTEDRAIPAEAQEFMAERAGATTTEIAASHAVMVSHPDAVVAIIDEAREGVA